MKCEICHKADAATVLHRKKKDGSDEELYVCKDCLASNGKKKPSAESKVSASILSPDGEEPPAFIKNFLDAAVGLIEGVAESGLPKLKKCRVCGATWEKIKSECRVGCPYCWS